MVRRRRKSLTSGAMLLEAMIALALLLVVVGFATQTCTAMVRQRRSMQKARMVLDAKANLMAYAMALPYEKVGEEILLQHAKTLTVSKLPAKKKLTWDVQVTDTADENGGVGKRIRASLISDNQSSAGLGAVRPMVCWRFPTAGRAVEP